MPSVYDVAIGEADNAHHEVSKPRNNNEEIGRKDEMRNFIKLTCAVAVAIFAATQAQAIVLTNDNFNSYSDGDLAINPGGGVSGGIWSNFNGSTAMNVQGFAVFVTGTASKDDQLRFDSNPPSTGPHTNDVLFACFNVTAVALATSTANGGGAYFAMFKDDSTFNFVARVEVTNDTAAGAVRFGIANQASTSTNAGVAWWASSTPTGTTHFVVIRLDLTGVNISSTMWIDPTDITDPSITATDLGALAPGTNLIITAYGLRQSNAQQGGVLVDNLNISTEFADQIPEPSTIFLVGTGLVGFLAIRRRRS